jgi:peptidoglycan hydrolase CwlO-like protein
VLISSFLQNNEDIRDKSVAKNKSQNLLDKVGTLERENEDLSHQMDDLKDEMTKSRSEIQTTKERIAVLEQEARTSKVERELGLHLVPK